MVFHLLSFRVPFIFYLCTSRDTKSGTPRTLAQIVNWMHNSWLCMTHPRAGACHWERVWSGRSVFTWPPLPPTLPSRRTGCQRPRRARRSAVLLDGCRLITATISTFPTSVLSNTLPNNEMLYILFYRTKGNPPYASRANLLVNPHPYRHPYNHRCWT